MQQTSNTRQDGPRFASTHVWITTVLVFATLTRVAYLYFFRRDPFYDYPIHDADVYMRWASTLASGGTAITGAYYHAPLYPLIMSAVFRAFGTQPLAIYLLQLAAGVGTIFLVYRTARAAYGEGAARCSSALAALYGVFLFYETRLLPTALVVLVAMAIVRQLQRAAAADRIAPWLAAGALVGVGSLLRPNLLLMVPLAWLAIGLQREIPRRIRINRLLGYTLLALAVVSPVTIRNVIVARDRVLISSNGGITFYQGNNPSARGLFSAVPGTSGSILEQRVQTRALAEEARGRSLRDSEVSRYWFSRGIEFITHDPPAYAVLELRKAFLALDNYEHALEYNPQLDENPVRYLTPVPFALILACAALRLFARRRVTSAELPLYLMLAVFAVSLLAFYAAGRYRLPAVGPLLVVAGCGLATLGERLRGPLRGLIAPLAVGLAVLALSVAPLPGGRLEIYRHGEAMGLCDRAEAQFAAGHSERAIADFRAATRRDPTYPWAQVNLANALRENGQRDTAEAAARAAVRLAPQLPAAHSQLGLCLYETERYAEAADAFAVSFRLDPTDADTGNNLIGSSIRAGRVDQAVAVWRELHERGLRVDPPIEHWMRRNTGRAGDR